MIALLILASASLIFVESAVSFGCQQRGRKTTEESWNCSRNGDITCTKRTRICSHDGEELEESGYEKFGRFGESFSVGGGGWDCREMCRNCAGFTCTGSREGTSVSLPQPPSPPRPSAKTCDYQCRGADRGCTVTYTGPPRVGLKMGSCFSRSFGGRCFGTPPECLDCNLAISC